MIRKNLINCKLFFLNVSIPEHYKNYMRRFNPALERCPYCGAKGQCRVFAYYERGVVEIENGQPVYYRLRITRVRCSCGHTHAILPDTLVPYRQYSLSFILHVLGLYYAHSMTIQQIYDTYAVAHPVLYRWLRIFGRHARIWLGMTSATATFAGNFLQSLADMDPFSSFTSGFYQLTLLSFLQTHANPANCRHQPPGFMDSGLPATQRVHSFHDAGRL